MNEQKFKCLLECSLCLSICVFMLLQCFWAPLSVLRPTEDISRLLTFHQLFFLLTVVAFMHNVILCICIFVQSSMHACVLFIHCLIICTSRWDCSALCFMYCSMLCISEVSLALYGKQIFTVEGTTHPSVYLSCKNRVHQRNPNAWFSLYAMSISSFLSLRTLFSFFFVSLAPSLAVFLGVILVCRKRLLLFNL